MQFPAPPRRPRAESIVPMINVVFLLLIFFLMTAQIAPPDPFAVTPPEAAAGDPADGPLVLYLSAEGQIGFRDTLDEAALAALQAELANDPEQTKTLMLRADALAPALALARLMPRLADMGLRDVQLITVMP